MAIQFSPPSSPPVPSSPIPSPEERRRSARLSLPSTPLQGASNVLEPTSRSLRKRSRPEASESRVLEKKRRRLSAPEVETREELPGRSKRTRTGSVASKAIEDPARPNHRKRKSLDDTRQQLEEREHPSKIVGTRKKSRKSVDSTFLKESPARRSLRSEVAQKRRSTRKVPALPRRALTPLGAAAAILASSSHVGTLPPSAFSPPSRASARRFTRSSLAALNTQQYDEPQEICSPMTSPLTPTSSLSPLSPPGSPLSTTSSLGAPLSPNQVASAQTQSKSPAKLASTSAPTIRRIATRSSGLPLVEAGLLVGAARRRSPLAFASESASTMPTQSSSASVPLEKGKGRRTKVTSGPSRRSTRLSGVDRGHVASSTASSPLTVPSSSPPSLSPPSPPLLRPSLSPLSPPAPAPAAQRKPHTPSPLSASASSDASVSHSVTGSTSPLKESSSKESGVAASNQLPSANGSPNQSHTPPGSPTRSGSSQMEIDAVDFGTMPMMLPGPSLALSQVGVFGSGAQTSPPSQLAGKGQRQERAGSPTSPTERRIPLAPLLPSALLSAAAANAGGREVECSSSEESSVAVNERDESGWSEDEMGEGHDAAQMHDPQNNVQQLSCPPRVEIPAEPASQQEQFGEHFSDMSHAQSADPVYQSEGTQAQTQYQYVAPPPSYTWEEPPRLDNERNLWRLACKVRVWDLRRRYSLETIRSLVTHEAHEYYAKNGFPTGYFSSSYAPVGPAGMTLRSIGGGGPRGLRAQALSRQVSSGSSEGESPTSPLNFMDEPVYDWEIAMSDEEDAEEDDDDDEDDDEEYEEVDEVEERGAVGADSEVRAEEDEEERRQRHRRRRSSLLRHLRKPGRDSDEGSSPDAEPTFAMEKGANENAIVKGPAAPAEMDVDIDLDIEDLDEALDDPNFNIELSSCASASASPTSPQQISPSSPAALPPPAQTNGVFTSFYVPPVQQIPVPQQVFVPQPLPPQDTSSSALSSALGSPAVCAERSALPVSPTGTSAGAAPSLLIDTMTSSPPVSPPPLQLALQTISIPMHVPSPTPAPIMDLPPPRLSSVPVWALRNMEMSGGNMGKGTPVNRERALEWASAWTMNRSRPCSSRAASLMRSESLMSSRSTADAAVAGFAVGGGGEASEEAGRGGAGKEQDFRMEADREGRNSIGEDRKPVLSLRLPGEVDLSGLMMPALGTGTPASTGSSNGADSVVMMGASRAQLPPLANTTSPGSSSIMMAPFSSKQQSMLMESAFEPSNQADWDAFLASLAAPLSGGSFSSSHLMGAVPQVSSQQVMGDLEHDHHRTPPPPYSSLHPSHSPPPTPTPPSPASSTCSLSQDNASGSTGGASMSIQSPGTSAGQAGAGGSMFGMMNVNMMFGVGGGQNNGGPYSYQHQGQGHVQQQQQQQGGGSNDGGGQPCFPSMGVTMSMPPPGMGMNNNNTSNAMHQHQQQQQQPSYNNASFNSMPSFNMGMGLGMNPTTMNMNLPLNMGMGMPMPMQMPMMQMPMSMPFAGLQLGVTLSLAPQQHSPQQQQQQKHQPQHQPQHQQHQQLQLQAGQNHNQGQLQWGGGGSGVNGNGMDFDLINFGNGMGMGQQGGGGVGLEGVNMFSLVNTPTPTNTPMNSPLSASIPSSMLGVLGPGPGSNDNEKGGAGAGAGATPSTLSYALG